MKKIYSIALAIAAMAAASVSAADYTVLSTPEDVLNNSVETVAGTKATFESVLNNASATDAEKLDAMHIYMTDAEPAPGYAFDMSFLLSYNEATSANSGKYTQANLASVWKNDIGVTFGSGSVLITFSNPSHADWGQYMRVNAPNELKLADNFGKFIAYQEVNLTKGNYELQARAFVSGLANLATLSADENDSKNIAGGGSTGLQDYTVSFKIAEPKDVKLGFKRNSTAGNMTQIAFNNIYLYKTSNVIVIKDDAIEGLAAATGVDVQLQREFAAGEYYPICLPFSVTNWKDKFADVVAGSRIEDKQFGKCLVLATITQQDMAARKPYLVKLAENISADNYLLFENVTVTSGNAGSWGSADASVLTGNWAATTVPAGAYVYNGKNWTLSDGTAHQMAFSAYVPQNDGVTAETLYMQINGETTTAADLIAADENTIVDVYNLHGICVRHGVEAADALNGLSRGIYIINGKKIVK